MSQYMSSQPHVLRAALNLRGGAALYLHLLQEATTQNFQRRSLT